MTSRELAEQEWHQGLHKLRDLERLGLLTRLGEMTRIVHGLSGIVDLSPVLQENGPVMSWLHSTLEEINDQYRGAELREGAAPCMPSIAAALDTLLQRAGVEPLAHTSPLREPAVSRAPMPLPPPISLPPPPTLTVAAPPRPAAPRIRKLERALLPIASAPTDSADEDAPATELLAEVDVDAQAALQELFGDPSNQAAPAVLHRLKGALFAARLNQAGNAVHSLEEGILIHTRAGGGLGEPRIRDLCREAASRITRITQAALDGQMEEYATLCRELRGDAETLLGRSVSPPAPKAEEPAGASKGVRRSGTFPPNDLADLVREVWRLTETFTRFSGHTDARNAEEAEYDVQIARLRAIQAALNAKDRQGALFGDQGEIADQDGRRPGFALLDLTRSTPLNHLVVQLGEIADSLAAVRRAQLERQREQTRSVDAANTTLARLRERIMGLRLERFEALEGHCRGAVIDTMNRENKDRLENKDVRLEFLGGEVMLDTNTVRIIRPALQQLCRNAVAHGIERERPAGKNPRGTVTVQAAPGDPGVVVISVSDDGAGLNFRAIEQRAESLGKPRPPAGWTTRDLLNVLFEPGFTTRETAGGAAGRGQGMDVIARTVEAAGGSMRVESSEGRGTTFRLELPTQLDYAEMMMVQSGGLPYAIRRAGVRGVDERLPADFWSPGTPPLIPCQRASNGALMHALLLPRALGHPEVPPDEGWPVLELSTSAGPMFLAVDRILQTMPAHIRLLDPILMVPPWSGITSNPDGRAALVLEPASIWQACERGVLPPAILENAPALARQRALVADDSSSVRRALSGALHTAGWDADTFTNGEAAYEAFHRAPQGYAAVLTDLEMPRCNGYELLARIRVLNPGVPVLVITSRASAAHQEEARKLGASAYLTKPIDAEELHSHLERWCPAQPPALPLPESTP